MIINKRNLIAIGVCLTLSLICISNVYSVKDDMQLKTAYNQEFETTDSLTFGVSKLFPGSDFDDWGAFLSNVFPNKSEFVKQSDCGKGIDGRQALSLSWSGHANKRAIDLFTAKTPPDFTLKGKNKISFYINGKAKFGSFVVILNSEEENHFYTYYLGTITTEDVVCEPILTPSTDKHETNDYSGTVDTKNLWVKVTLDIAPNKLEYGYSKTAGKPLIAFRLYGETKLDLLIDDLAIE